MAKLIYIIPIILVGVLAVGTAAPSASAATIEFTASTSVNPLNPSLNEPTTAHVMVKNLKDPVGDTIVDIEIYRDGVKIFQQFFEHQSFTTLESKFYSVNFTPDANGSYRVKVGVFSSGWSATHYWKENGSSFFVGESTFVPANQIDIWWPADGSRVSGVQPFKALVRDLPLDQYEMFWRVDEGQLNPMFDSVEDWPHKEAIVDLSGWNWRPDGSYTLAFLAKDSDGRVFTARMVSIEVAP